MSVIASSPAKITLLTRAKKKTLDKAGGYNFYAEKTGEGVRIEK